MADHQQVAVFKDVLEALLAGTTHPGLKGNLNIIYGELIESPESEPAEVIQLVIELALKYNAETIQLMKLLVLAIFNINVDKQ